MHCQWFEWGRVVFIVGEKQIILTTPIRFDISIKAHTGSSLYISLLSNNTFLFNMRWLNCSQL